jgi:8-oxo-dGTP pyrophosphatase MutT (NUDIX family)
MESEVENATIEKYHQHYHMHNIVLDSEPLPAETKQATKIIDNPKIMLSYVEAVQYRKIQNARIHDDYDALTMMNKSQDSLAESSAASAASAASAKHFCNNCNRTNHLYNNCRSPVTSIGIIAFRSGHQGPEFLMIRRRDSFGFVDFVRGKYSLNDEVYIQRIIDEMTIYEKDNLIQLTFDQLWKLLWGEYTRGSQYKNEESISCEKYNQIVSGIRTKDGKRKTLQQFINDSNTRWSETEWGFPKGRRNYNEKDLTCALRECLEETGYDITCDNIIQNILPFEEIFMGSDMKCYKQKYFLAMVDLDKKPKKAHDIMEVGLMKWMTYDDCIHSIRPYNLEKIAIIEKINNILKKYQIY